MNISFDGHKLPYLLDTYGRGGEGLQNYWVMINVEYYDVLDFMGARDIRERKISAQPLTSV